MPKQLQTGMLPQMLAATRWLCRQSWCKWVVKRKS